MLHKYLQVSPKVALADYFQPVFTKQSKDYRRLHNTESKKASSTEIKIVQTADNNSYQKLYLFSHTLYFLLCQQLITVHSVYVITNIIIL